MTKFTDADIDRISLNLATLIMNIMKHEKRMTREAQTIAKIQCEIIEAFKLVRGR